jgi:predicted GH43/DUF377 family glycosyl hydrolase
MKWTKKGLIYCPSGKYGFDVSHCHKPTPLVINEDTIRIYFGVRDKYGKSRTTFIDIDINDLDHIKYIHNKPILDLGKIGAFDDSGVNVSSVVKIENEIFMYFIGWNPSTTVHTRNSIGIAISKDNGFTFERMYDGPILDRTKDEPYYTGAVDVKYINDEWMMWYTSGSEWKIINDRPEIWYHIKFAHSKNGIDWDRDNILCIPPLNESEVTARPSILHEKGLYRMWYSKRSIIDFRTNLNAQYRAGYAESTNGINWKRDDSKVGIDISKTGWDSEAIAYPYVIDVGEKLLMFYNGNGFGKTGFGCAELYK